MTRHKSRALVLTCGAIIFIDLALLVMFATPSIVDAATTWLVQSNNAKSTLASTITAGATSLTVAAGTGALFPSTYPYRLVIGGTEIVQVSNRATDVMTISRGSESTTPAQHLAGESVRLNMTAGYLSQVQTSVTGIETGTTTLTKVTTTGDADIGGDLLLGGSFTWTPGSLSLANLTVTNTATINTAVISTGTVTNNWSVTGDLSVTGGTTLSTVTAMTGTITTAGITTANIVDANVSNDLDVIGDTSLASFTANTGVVGVTATTPGYLSILSGTAGNQGQLVIENSNHVTADDSEYSKITSDNNGLKVFDYITNQGGEIKYADIGPISTFTSGLFTTVPAVLGIPLANYPSDFGTTIGYVGGPVGGILGSWSSCAGNTVAPTTLIGIPVRVCATGTSGDPDGTLNVLDINATGTISGSTVSALSWSASSIAGNTVTAYTISGSTISATTFSASSISGSTCTSTYITGSTISSFDISVGHNITVEGTIKGYVFDSESSMILGVTDSTAGLVHVYGSTTSGGEIKIDNGADDDTTIDFWSLRSLSNGTFVIGPDVSSVGRLSMWDGGFGGYVRVGDSSTGTHINLYGDVSYRMDAIVADDTTPAVSYGVIFTIPNTWTSGHNITGFDSDVLGGQVLYFVAEPGDTDCVIENTLTLKLSANWTAAPNATLSVVKIGSGAGDNWYELSRSP